MAHKHDKYCIAEVAVRMYTTITVKKQNTPFVHSLHSSLSYVVEYVEKALASVQKNVLHTSKQGTETNSHK